MPILGLQSSSRNISSYGMISYGAVWRTGFEDPTFSEFGTLPDGVVIQDPAVGSTVTLVTNPVFNGKTAAKCQLEHPELGTYESNKAMAARVKETRSMLEGYYGCAFWLPPNFNVKGGGGWIGLVIHQLHTNWYGDNFVELVIVSPESSPNTYEPGETGLKFRLRCRLHGPPSTMYGDLWIGEAGGVPLGRWFTVVVYLRATQNGEVKLWIDEELKSRTLGDFRTDNWDEAPVEHRGCQFCCGLYESPNDYPQYLILDEMICATTLGGATPQAR